MNHFIFPYIATRGKTTALYGDIVTITLLKMMLARESSIKSLEAQIYGGVYHPEKTLMTSGGKILKWPGKSF